MISDELKKIKAQTGTTARHLAAMCDVTEQTIWNWIRGVSVPPADKMDVIRQFFKDETEDAE